MGLDADYRLLAPRDERFALEVRSDLPESRPVGGDGSCGVGPAR